jgi:hypothetical protein
MNLPRANESVEPGEESCESGFDHKPIPSDVVSLFWDAPIDCHVSSMSLISPLR